MMMLLMMMIIKILFDTFIWHKFNTKTNSTACDLVKISNDKLEQKKC